MITPSGNVSWAEIQTKFLAGNGVTVGGTSITVSGLVDILGNPITMSAYFGTLGTATLEQGTPNERSIAFTGITVNGNGTSTLTGINTINMFGNVFSVVFAGSDINHAGGTSIDFSDGPVFWSFFGNLYNDQAIVGTWLCPDPTQPMQIVNKEYVDALVISGAPAASTILPGISMEATQIDTDARTASRMYLGNPYELFINPTTLRATQYNSYQPDTGGVNTLVITVPNSTVSYTAGDTYIFEPAHTNTGPATLNVNAVGAIPIVKNVSEPLSGRELVVGSLVQVVYDGTNFQIIGNSSDSSLEQNTVNADENSFGWVTSYFLIGDTTAWTGTVDIQYANGAQITNPNTVETANALAGWNDTPEWANALLPGLPGKIIKMKVTASTNCNNVSGPNTAAVGMCSRVTNIYSKTNHSDNRVQFLMDNTSMYSITTDATGITITTLGGISVGLTNPHVLEIVLNCQNQADFYVDGVLKATHTTNIPTVEVIGPIILALGGNGEGVAEIFASGLTISQSL